MSTAYVLAFTVGALSALHCIGMCGGIVGALSFSVPAQVRREWLGYLSFLLAYNAGRVASYALAGALFGSLGQVLTGAGGQVWLQVLAGLTVVALGLSTLIFQGYNEGPT